MLKYLTIICTEQLNLLTAKVIVSKYLIPHVIMTKRDLDFEKHWQVPFGDSVQANKENDPTNTNAPQTIYAIYLFPMINKQVGNELMKLATVQVITLNRVWEQPVTDLVVKSVEEMATEQGIKTLNCREETRS